MKTSSKSKDDTPHHARQQFVAAEVLRRVALVVAVAATLCLFLVPIVFYCTLVYGHSAADSSSDNSLPTVNNASINETSTECTVAWGMRECQEAAATCERYQGTVCLPYLSEWQRCIPPTVDGADLIVAVSADLQATLDKDILQLQEFLTSFPACKDMAVPFLCHYFFPLMKDCITGECYEATREDCTFISTTVCAAPWNLALSVGYGNKLPSCLSLPSKNDSGLVNDTAGTDNSNNYTWGQNVSCREDFFLENSTCYPRCDRFEEHPHTAIQVMLIAEVIAGVIAFVVTISALGFSVYNRKNMIKFPSFLLLFFVIDVLLAACLILITAMDRNKLLCSSKNLIEAVDNPAPYCLISGALFHYLIVNMAMWWFFHLCVFFYEIMFPFDSLRRKKSGQFKYLALILVVLGFFVPLPGVIIALTFKKHQYRIIRFPPDVCTTDNELWFFTTTLIFTVVIGIGICLLIIIFWTVNKHQSSNARRDGKKKTLSTAEKKIILVAVSFIVFGVFTMIHLGIVTGNADKVVAGFTEYFICESAGHVPGKCDRSVFERHLYPYMSVIAYILMGTIPMAILNFIVNWQKLWKSVKKLFTSSDKGTNSSRLTSRTSSGRRFSFERMSIRSIKLQPSVMSIPPTTPV